MANSRAWRVWGPLGGLAFVVLFVIGSALIFDGPNGDESPAKYLDFYGDSGNRDKINIGWVLAGLGVFFFLWFVASLRETVRKATVASEGDSMLGVSRDDRRHCLWSRDAGGAGRSRWRADDERRHVPARGVSRDHPREQRRRLHRPRDRDCGARGDDLRVLDHRPRNAGRCHDGSAGSDSSRPSRP